MRAWWLAVLVACGGQPSSWILEGTVVEVRPDEVVVDHQDIAGLMGAMVMPFEVGEDVPPLQPGDRIYARLERGTKGLMMKKVRVTGHQPGYTPPASAGPLPLQPGEALDAVQVLTPGGEAWTVGAGQGVPTALTFVYTTCPLQEFCPATVRRLQELQAQTDWRLVAVTVDPAGDTLDVLGAFAAEVGADAARWRFGRVEGAAYEALLRRAHLTVLPKDGGIEHGTRWLFLDAAGKLVQRVDANDWTLDAVRAAMGAPASPASPASPAVPASPAAPAEAVEAPGAADPG